MQIDGFTGLEVLNGSWAVADETLALIQGLADRVLRGDMPPGRASVRTGDVRSRGNDYNVRDGVAVLSLSGIMTKNPTILGRYFQETASADLARLVMTAADDSSIKAIALDVDSPGGMVDGTEALANAIYLARMKKTVVAVIDGTGASAAYWAASAANNVYITARTTEVGSIGVVAMHIDFSGAEKQRGVVISEITAGKHKRIASEHAPLTQEGRDSIQGYVDSIYSVFLADVAKHRGVSIETVKSRMADGRLFIGGDAIKSGLVDGIKSLDEVVAELAATSRKPVEKGKPLSANDAYMAEVRRLKASGLWGEKAMRQALESPLYLEAVAREAAAKPAAAVSRAPVPVAPKPAAPSPGPLALARDIAASATEFERLLAKAGIKVSPAEACALVTASRSKAMPTPRILAHLAAAEEQRIKEQKGLPITTAQAIARVTARFNQ